ncbi:MAG: helix-hairpin-helix domain-containing protein [Prevotellaceae bacterium]|nr:helix-hairpin-helix domain-containing protein [Prevotellaceae bacterium]
MITLLAVLALTIAAMVIVPEFLPKPTIESGEDFLTQFAEFKNSLKDRQYQKYSPFDEKRADNKYFTNKNIKPIFFIFNPNTLDSVGFVKLGLKPFIAKNILNYRKKGKKFKTKDDFSKVYGISTEQFTQLKPYILIPPDIAQGINNQPKKEFEQKYSVKIDTIIELNTADTTDLKKLRGIGSGWAKAIVAYRQRLGGYYSVKQLLEIKNFSHETFEKIEKKLTVDASKIQQIEVNRANVDYMRKHPYLDFYKSKAIYELRRNKILQSIDELKSLPDFSVEELKKIEPYLNFKKIERKYR